MIAIRIKICGITRAEDAWAAVNAGADAVGFIFAASSPRYIAPALAGEIGRDLPPFVARVGVFVDEPAGSVRSIAATADLDTVQLHGRETPALIEELRSGSFRLIKAIRVRDESSLAPLPTFDVSAFLLDSYVAGQHGGTGEKFNWDLAIQAKRLGKPIILAGGLTPENVREAIQAVQPFGIDVSSGVEQSPGIKDHDKIRRLIASAKSAAA